MELSMNRKHWPFSRNNVVTPATDHSLNGSSSLSVTSSVKHLIPSLSTFNLPPCHPITPFDATRPTDIPPPTFACDPHNTPKGHVLLSSISAGDGIRPVQLLLERLDAWHILAKRLYDHFQKLAHVETQVARVYQKLDGVLGFKEEEQNEKQLLLHTHFSIQEQGNKGIRQVCDAWQAYHADNTKAHAEFGNFLRTHALPVLSNVKRELKWMTRTIRSDDRLTLSTLAKLREEATKRLERLESQLLFFDQHPHHGHTKQDPWIINAAVVKQIIKVYRQENKVHETVLRLQREAMVSEGQLMEDLQELFRQIYTMRERSALGLDKGLQRMMHVFDQVKPGADWNNFAERSKDHLISDNAAFRHPDQLQYPNHSHPLLQPLFAARMERKSSILHNWNEYIYVLTPAGFLHEYRNARAYPIMPSASIYVPHYTVSSLPTNFHHNLVFKLQPHSAAHQLQGSMSSLAEGWASSGSFRKTTKALTFRAKSAHDMQTWLQRLTELSNRFTPISYCATSPVMIADSPTTLLSPSPPIHPSEVLPEPTNAEPAKSSLVSELMVSYVSPLPQSTVLVTTPHPSDSSTESTSPPPATAIGTTNILSDCIASHSDKDVQNKTDDTEKDEHCDNLTQDTSTTADQPQTEDNHMKSILTGVCY